jgi:hypothetical protein
MAASLAVRTSLEWSARSRSAALWCWSCDSRGTILTATWAMLAVFLIPSLPSQRPETVHHSTPHPDERVHPRTCSPVSKCFASLTLPMLPAPIVFPSDHVPVLGAVMVVLRLVLACCICPDLPSAATPLTGIADAVDASDAYRAWLLLLDSVRVGVGAGRSLDSLRRTLSFARLLCSQSRAATLLRPCGWRVCE